jgi:hypothetical protein
MERIDQAMGSGGAHRPGNNGAHGALSPQDNRQEDDMARKNADWEPDIGEAPVTAPKNRDQLVQENRARRIEEPAAAPLETDSESGTPGTVPSADRQDSARTRAEKVAGTEKRDVRAGPGDAGAADTPTRSPERLRGTRDNWRRALVILVAIAVIWVLLGLVF